MGGREGGGRGAEVGSMGQGQVCVGGGVRGAWDMLEKYDSRGKGGGGAKDVRMGIGRMGGHGQGAASIASRHAERQHVQAYNLQEKLRTSAGSDLQATVGSASHSLGVTADSLILMTHESMTSVQLGDVGHVLQEGGSLLVMPRGGVGRHLLEIPQDGFHRDELDAFFQTAKLVGGSRKGGGAGVSMTAEQAAVGLFGGEGKDGDVSVLARVEEKGGGGGGGVVLMKGCEVVSVDDGGLPAWIQARDIADVSTITCILSWFLGFEFWLSRPKYGSGMRKCFFFGPSSVHPSAFINSGARYWAQNRTR